MPTSRSQTPQSPRTLREPGDRGDPRAALARAIPRRPAVSRWLGIVLAAGFALVVAPAIIAERWPLQFRAGTVVANQPAPFTVRAPMLAGYDLRVGGGVVVARGETATPEEAAIADAIAEAMPRGPVLYLALFALVWALAAACCHAMRRSTRGRLLRVQIVGLAAIAVVAIAAKLVLLSTAVSALAIPVAVLAMVPALALDRVVGVATGVLAALVVALLAPLNVGLAILLVVQAAAAGLAIAERPRRRWATALTGGAVATLATGAAYVLLAYLTTGRPPELRDPLHSAWLAAAIGPAFAAVIAAPLVPLYQLLVGEITERKLIALEDLGHPLLRQIAERAPGTWQHSLMMANMAELAANAIGASGRLVRVGAYFHDLGKAMQPTYFVENLEPGETSPHDRLPPEASCDAIFAHVTEGIAAARKARLHERIVDFLHMHHGDGVLEYFWARCQDQGNPNALTIERFRYPGHRPHSRETAILAICDAVEAASRTLHKPDAAAIDALVQRIVYGKLDLGQFDDSGLSPVDLRRITDSLRETLRHANHGRTAHAWQHAGQDASATAIAHTAVSPPLDALDRNPARDPAAPPPPAASSDDALAVTADIKDSDQRPRAPRARAASESSDPKIRAGTARNALAAPAREPVRPHGEPVRAPSIRASSEGNGASDERAPAPGAQASSERARTSNEDRGASNEGVGASNEGGRTSNEDRGASNEGVGARNEGSRASNKDGRASDEGVGSSHPPVRAGNEVVTITPRRQQLERQRAHAEQPRTPDNGGAARDVATTLPGHAKVPTTPPGHEARDVATTLPGQAPGDVATTLPRQAAGDASTTLPRQAAGDASTTHPRQATGDGSTALPNPVPGDVTTTLPEQVRQVAATSAGRAPVREIVTLPGPLPPPPELATPAAFGTQPLPLVVARTGTPTAHPRPPTTPPVLPMRHPTSPPTGELRMLPVDPASATRTPSSPPEIAAHAPHHPVATPPSGGRPAVVEPARTAGAPVPAPLQPASANPPPARGPSGKPVAPPDPAQIAAALAAIVSRVSAAPFGGPRSPEGPPPAAAPAADSSVDPVSFESRTTDRRTAVSSDLEARVTDQRRSVVPAAADDAGITEPSMPALEIGDERSVDVRPAPPIRRTPPVVMKPRPPAPPKPHAQSTAAGAGAAAEAAPGWGTGLAARVDAAIVADDWGKETPVASPTSAELRVLFGHPDPTRQLAVDEVELLQRRAAELAQADPPRRPPPATAEVDPEDIEAAIELAPPARRPVAKNIIEANRPKKSE